MFKRRMKLNIIPVIIIKSCSYRPKQNGRWMCKQPQVIALVSAKPHIPMYLVIKFQKPFETPNLKLLGLHFIWKCATFTWDDTGKRQSWKKCISTTRTKVPGFQLGWSHLPHNTGTEGAMQQGLTHLPGTIAVSPHQNAVAERVLVATLTHFAPITRPLCYSFGLSEAKQNSSPLCHVGAEPERCTQTERRERGCLWRLQAECRRDGTWGRQIQGANGTIFISMIMQRSECISSLLARVHYYYLYLSSI